MIDWNRINKEDMLAITRIAKRAVAFCDSEGMKMDQMSTVMDLQACHTHGCKLDLPKLEAAKEGDLMHDVCGIARHLDHDTGELTDCFVPRCAA